MIPVDEIELEAWLAELQSEIRGINRYLEAIGHDSRRTTTAGLRNFANKISRAMARITPPTKAVKSGGGVQFVKNERTG